MKEDKQNVNYTPKLEHQKQARLKQCFHITIYTDMDYNVVKEYAGKRALNSLS